MIEIQVRSRALLRAYLRIARSFSEPMVRRKALANVREAFYAGDTLDLGDPQQEEQARDLLANGERMLPVWKRVADAPPATQALFGRKLPPQ